MLTSISTNTVNPVGPGTRSLARVESLLHSADRVRNWLDDFIFQGVHGLLHQVLKTLISIAKLLALDSRHLLDLRLNLGSVCLHGIKYLDSSLSILLSNTSTICVIVLPITHWADRHRTIGDFGEIHAILQCALISGPRNRQVTAPTRSITLIAIALKHRICIRKWQKCKFVCMILILMPEDILNELVKVRPFPIGSQSHENVPVTQGFVVFVFPAHLLERCHNPRICGREHMINSKETFEGIGGDFGMLILKISNSLIDASQKLAHAGMVHILEHTACLDELHEGRCYIPSMCLCNVTNRSCQSQPTLHRIKHSDRKHFCSSSPE